MNDALHFSGPAAGSAGRAVGSTLFIPSTAVEQVLRWDEMIARLRDAYSVPLPPEAMPPRSVARGSGTWFRSLTAAPPSSRYMGAKVFGMSRGRMVSYLIVLMDNEDGGFAGLVDAFHVTSSRTGATSAVAVDRIAPTGPKVVGILGSGAEAKSHLSALAAVRPIVLAKIFSPTRDNREAFAAQAASTLGIRAEPVESAQAAVRDADVVVACARSRGEVPILFGDWLRPGTMVVSIGSTLPEQREIDASVVERCDMIVCDAVEEVVGETGDMIAARAEGVEFRDKLCSLNDLMLGRVDSQLASARLPMFKSVGSAMQDIIIAELALERAIQHGLGLPMPSEIRTRRPRVSKA